MNMRCENDRRKNNLQSNRGGATIRNTDAKKGKIICGKKLYFQHFQRRQKKMTKDEVKNRISMALKDPVLQQGFEIICKNLAELEKENAELQEKISILLSCQNCPENKGGWICAKEYDNKCLAQKITFIKELKKEKRKLLGIIRDKDKVIQELKKKNCNFLIIVFEKNGSKSCKTIIIFILCRTESPWK